MAPSRSAAHKPEFLNSLHNCTQAPQIDCLVVLLSLQNFGWDVLLRSAERASSPLHSGRPPKIADLGEAIAEHYILWLEIAMRNILVVHLLDGLADFPEEHDRLGLWKRIPKIHVVEKRAALHILQHQVDVVLIRHHRVELHYIGVAQEGLDLDFLD